jgi:putative phage-type endonuclease
VSNYIKLLNISTITRDEWLAARRNGIGGSDAAAILGLNDWSSPYEVYADKLGLLPQKDETEAMRQGKDFEEYVARRFMEKTGKLVRRMNYMLQSCANPFMLADVDRIIVGEDAGLECKTTSVMQLSKFKNGDYPAHYYCQCMHYLAVTGFKKWYLAVLVLNQGFYIFEIERDEDEIAALIKSEAEFWHLVQNRTPPPVDGLPATERAINAVYPECDVEMPLYGLEDTLTAYKAAKETVKAAKKEHDRLEQEILLKMEGAVIGRARGFEVTNKTISRGAYTVQATNYKKFNVKEVELSAEQ